MTVVRDQTKKQKISMYFVQSKNGKRNPSWVRIRKWKKTPFLFHLAKMTMVTSGILRLQKRNRWLQLLVDCANSIVPHKEFSRATLFCSCSAPGGSYFVKRTTRKNWKVPRVRANPLTGMNWIFCNTLSFELLRSCSKLQCQHCKLSSGVGNRVFRDSLPLTRGRS